MMNQNFTSDSTTTTKTETNQMETTTKDNQEDTDTTTSFPFLGLGYHSATRLGGAVSTSSGTDDRGSVSTSNSTNVSVVEQILQQCLQYHHEQEMIRNEQLEQQQQSFNDPSYTSGTNLNIVGSNVVTKDDTPFQVDFVRATIVMPNNNNNNCDDNKNNNNNYSNTATTIVSTSHIPPPHQQQKQQEFHDSIEDESLQQQQLEERMKQSKVRAQALIERFHQQQQQLLRFQQSQPQVTNDDGHQEQRNDMSQTMITDQMTMMNTPPLDDHRLSHSTTTTMGTVPDPTMLWNDHHNDSSLEPFVVPSPLLYSEQRRIGFEREIERKRLAHVRNIQYIQQIDEQRLINMEHQIQVSKEYENRMKQQYEQKRIQRKERIQQQQNMMSYGGIGTKERKVILKHQAKDYKTNQNNTNTKNNNTDHSNSTTRKKKNETGNMVTVALYVSGLDFLKNNNNKDENRHLDDHHHSGNEEDKEKEMKHHMNSFQQLFASYGIIQKIHYYQEYNNKSVKQQQKSGSGGVGTKYKGDCLVIYNCRKQIKKEEDVNNNNTVVVGVLDDENPENLIRIVCEQLNGAELACGSILHVEPASSNMKTNHSTTNIDPNGKRDLLSAARVPGKEDDTRNQKFHDEKSLSGDDDDVTHDEHEKNKSEKKLKGEEGMDEELDDFFDSL